MKKIMIESFKITKLTALTTNRAYLVFYGLFQNGD
jgi:hypothetical protein